MQSKTDNRDREIYDQQLPQVEICKMNSFDFRKALYECTNLAIMGSSYAIALEWAFSSDNLKIS